MLVICILLTVLAKGNWYILHYRHVLTGDIKMVVLTTHTCTCLAVYITTKKLPEVKISFSHTSVV